VVLIAVAGIAPTQENLNEGQLVRCAGVGGLNEIDFWPQLADRFKRTTGYRMELVAVGPKHAIVDAFKSGEADVVLMHSSDALINLVADGFGENPQPWAKNDFVIVGPSSDPAKIRGENDAVTALRRIIETKSKLLVHSSSGANELLSDLLAAAGLDLDPQCTVHLASDKNRQMLLRAAAEQAYTLVGRIPFLSGKLDNSELRIMVQGDERLRRTYLVVTVADRKQAPVPKETVSAARRFAIFLREPATQEFISNFGKGRFDERPLLFPVKLP
jgi:tungstate transport system substrate-binding protein